MSHIVCADQYSVPSTPYHVVSVGDLVADMVLAIPSLPVKANQHQLISSYQIEPGGAGNFLITGTRLGFTMHALAVVGDDNYGDQTLDYLQQSGVDVGEVIIQHGGTTTLVIVLVDNKGDNVFLGKYGEGEVIDFPQSWRSVIEQAHAVQTWGYTFQEERMAEAMQESVALAASRKIPVFFDPGPFTQMVACVKIERLLKNVSVILLTNDEIPSVAQGRESQKGVDWLLEQGIQQVCVKQGATGCTIYSPNGTINHPGFRVALRDSTAAGDTFAAAYIHGFLHGWTLENIALFANAAGAVKSQKLGSGRSVPSAEEICRFLRDRAIALPFDLSVN